MLLLAGDAAERDEELTARIRGQTRDLAVTLKVASEAPPITAESARQHARLEAAQIAVWTEATGPAGLRVRVLDVESGGLRTRDVSTSQREALASSTTAEMAALVVRSELSALLAERAAPSLPPLAASVLEPPPAPPAPVPSRPTPKGDSPTWFLALGYRLSSPIRDALAHGYALAGRRELGTLLLGVSAVAVHPITLSDSEVELRLLRGGVRSELLRALSLGTALRLSVGGALGAVVTGRTTRSARLPLQGQASAVTAGATAGLLTELHWQWSRVLGLWLGAGVDAVLWRTKFAYELPEGRHQLGSLARFEPWLTVGFFARWAGAKKGP